MRKFLTGPRLILLGLLLLLAWGGYKAWRIATLAQSLQGRLNEAQALLPGGSGTPDVQAALALVHGTRADVVALRAEAGPFLALAPALGWVPAYGGDLVAAPHLLAIADDLTFAAKTAGDSLAPLLDTSAVPEGTTRLALATGALATARPALEQARAAVVHARDERAQIDAARLSERTARVLARLDPALPWLELGLDGALSAPDLLGWPQPRTYLILAQNDDELRPTGGFITAVGILRIERGTIAEMRFVPSYAVDDFKHPYPLAPDALYRTMGLDLWVLRDSNWSPDFPTAARQALALYQLTQPEHIDGVMAVDQPLLELLLGALGPVEVEGYDQPVSTANVIDYMREAWGAGERDAPDWASRHKDFIPKLAAQLMARVQAVSDPAEALALGKALASALDQRHLLVYVPGTPLQDLLAARAWDGALRPVTQDALLVADWNAGYNKTSANVAVAINYAVDLSGAQPAARVDVTYRNQAPDIGQPCLHQVRWGPDYAEQTQRCYWDYVRVFAPGGSELTGAAEHVFSDGEMWNHAAYTSTAVLEPVELGRAVFGNFLLVPRAQSTTTWFAYRLPPGVVVTVAGGRRYALDVQKQPGTRGHALAVAVTLPAGARVVSSTPPATVDGQVLHWTLTLDVDRAVEVIFAP
jgi:hypothetical protein